LADKKRITCARETAWREGIPDEQTNLLDRFRRSSFAIWHGSSYWDANRASKTMQCRNALTTARALVVSINRWTKMLVPRRKQSFQITIALA
jgi:hypothetical protein